MNIRVISGGQTGVDQAGLYAAAECGLDTGGYMPKGWRTQEGPRPEFADVFGMHEHFSPAYQPRTEWNVANAHATVILAKHFQSSGTLLTTNLCRKHNKPSVQVKWDAGTFSHLPIELARVILYDKSVHERFGNDQFTLNIAGNAEATALGIFDATFAYLMVVFTALKGTT